MTIREIDSQLVLPLKDCPLELFGHTFESDFVFEGQILKNNFTQIVKNSVTKRVSTVLYIIVIIILKIFKQNIPHIFTRILMKKLN